MKVLNRMKPLITIALAIIVSVLILSLKFDSKSYSNGEVYTLEPTTIENHNRLMDFLGPEFKEYRISISP